MSLNRLILLFAFLVFVYGCSVELTKEKYKGFDMDDFMQSKEYEEYRSSKMGFRQYIVYIEVPSYEETIKASNPGEASAIRAYLLRKYNIETERALLPKLITPTEN